MNIMTRLLSAIGKKLFCLGLCACILLAGNAHAALQSSKVLVLKNSVVDLVRNIEILRFDFTKGQNYCNVYKSVYGVPSSKLPCSTFSDYTASPFTANDGWRIGSGIELRQLFELVSGNTQYYAASWLTIYYTQGMDVWARDNLGGHHLTADGANRFVVSTNKPGGSNGQMSVMDSILYVHSAGEYGLRESTGTGTNYLVSPDKSILLVRDWLGYERPLYGVPTPLSSSALALFLATVWLRRQSRYVRK